MRRIFTIPKLTAQMAFILSYCITFGATESLYGIGMVIMWIFDVDITFPIAIAAVIIQLGAVIFALRGVQLTKKRTESMIGYVALFLSVLGFFILSVVLFLLASLSTSTLRTLG